VLKIPSGIPVLASPTRGLLCRAAALKTGRVMPDSGNEKQKPMQLKGARVGVLGWTIPQKKTKKKTNSPRLNFRPT
jgi:hypothetical protein